MGVIGVTAPLVTRQRRCRARVGAAIAVGVTLVAVGAAAASSIDRPAAVTVPADRGTALQATDTLPPAPGCARVVVIGDSLMDNARPWLVAGLRDAGFDAVVDAQPSRRIPGSVRAPYSGVRAAASVRATFGDAECWVVALGSNDLIFGGDGPAGATDMIDEMLAAVTPGAAVWWVNVNYHRDPRTNFAFAAATRTFNAALADRAAGDPALTVIDWYTLSEANRGWFFDPVHVDRAGSIVRAQQTVAALPPAG